MVLGNVAVVAPYDYGEVCAAACALVTTIESLPCKVLFQTTLTTNFNCPDIHFRYDKAVWTKPLGPEFEKAWRDIDTAIWFDREDYRQFGSFGMRLRKKVRERRHWLVDLKHELRQADYPGCQLLRPADIPCIADPWLAVYTHLIWASDRRIVSRKMQGPPTLLVLAGCSPEDTWALQYPRAGEQVASWLEAVPQARATILCPTPCRGSSNRSDITPVWWARLRDRYPERVEILLKPANYRERLFLFQNHDLVWSMSGGPLRLWAAEAAACGCLLLLNAEPEASWLDRFQPCFRLPPLATWLTSRARDKKLQDAEARATWQQACWTRARYPFPPERPALERSQREFVEFWRAAVSLPDTEF